MTLAYEKWIDIECAVVELLDDYGITQYPLNPRNIATLLGLSVIDYATLDLQAQKDFMTLSENGFLYINSIECEGKIYVRKDNRFPLRSYFSLAHEIAHWWLEHLTLDVYAEDEADYFAGYPLAPHPLILRHQLTQEKISKYFNIGDYATKVAYDQAWRRYKLRGSDKLPHEDWILNNLVIQDLKK